jgi:lipopolysaccharide biosynthesis glycosyltransferase
MRLYVLDGGLSEANRARLLWSWIDPRLSVEWLRPDMNQVRDLFVSDQVNAVTYLRVLMPDVLPDHVTRAIYLDADMLIRRDLGALWDEEQGDHAALAVPCVAAPYIDAAASMPRFEQCRAHLAAVTPVVNYRELGLPADGLYLNGGMLVADIARWRREKYSETMLKCLRDHRQHILWWDQYALNIVLARSWRALDYRWNQGAHLFVYPNWSESPFDRETYSRLRTDPWIVHFCSPSKPWHYFCRHPFRREFIRCLDRTHWQSWRPARPDNYFQSWWEFHSRPIRRSWRSNVRAFENALRRRRKAA